MAKDTPILLRNKIIYEIYVRNHTEEGNFQGVLNDLNRIKSLGVDMIWFMPVQPIGQLNKKGSLGCPYSIKDYNEINPEYGTIDEFILLIEAIHQLEMEVMLDVVFNHTSHDSVYRHHHPEYYFKVQNGDFGNKIADWSDIIDLDYSNKCLWEDQITSLEFWVDLGIDGFRCDVAPLIPMDFWKEARARLKKKNPGIIMLAETVHTHFVEQVRNMGFYAASDSEVYSVFDVCYDYDTHDKLIKYISSQIPLEEALILKRHQEAIYPDNYVKLRFLENHDQPRIAGLVKDKRKLENLTAFMFFEKGMTLLYAGQESNESKLPSLFDKDVISHQEASNDFYKTLKRLSGLKKDVIFSEGRYRIHDCPQKEVVLGSYKQDNRWLIGIFCFGDYVGDITLDWKSLGYFETPRIDGEFINEFNGQVLVVSNNHVIVKGEPILFYLS
jgi:glycosidase